MKYHYFDEEFLFFGVCHEKKGVNNEMLKLDKFLHILYLTLLELFNNKYKKSNIIFEKKSYNYVLYFRRLASAWK